MALSYCVTMLLEIFTIVVSLHRQVLISCGGKWYLLKLGYQLLWYSVFEKKMKTINFHFFLILGP